MIIEPNLRDLLVKLEFFGTMKVGHKPNIQAMTISDSNSWMDFFYRRITRETCDNVATEIEDLTTRSEEALFRYSLDAEIVQVILSKLDLFYDGVESIRKTYNKLDRIKSRLAIVLGTLNLIFQKQKFQRSQTRPQPIPPRREEPELIDTRQNQSAPASINSGSLSSPSSQGLSNSSRSQNKTNSQDSQSTSRSSCSGSS